jgi:hypothetical protein
MASKQDIKVRSLKALNRFMNELASKYCISFRRNFNDKRIPIAAEFVTCDGKACAEELDYLFRIMGKVAAIHCPDVVEGRELVDVMTTIYIDNNLTFLASPQCLSTYYNLKTPAGRVLNSDHFSRRLTQFLENPVAAMSGELRNPTDATRDIWLMGLGVKEPSLRTVKEATDWSESQKFFMDDFGLTGVTYGNLFDADGKPQHDLHLARAEMKK